MGLAGRLQNIQNQAPSTAPSAGAPTAPPTSSAAPSASSYGAVWANNSLAASSPSPANAPSTYGSSMGGMPSPYQQPSVAGQSAGAYGAPSSYSPAPQASSYTPSSSVNPYGSGYAAAPSGAAPSAVGPQGGITVDNLMAHLGGIAQKQGWQNRFWPSSTLREHCESLVHKDHVSALDMRESCPKQPLGLFSASLCDIVVLGDDSGSMRGDLATGLQDTGERWNELQTRFNTIAGIGSIFDSNGIDIYFLNDSKRWASVTATGPELGQLKQWMSGHKCTRSTPIGETLRSRLLPDIRSALDQGYLSKPVMVYVITDGVPDDKRAVSDAIFNFSEELAHKGYPRNSVLYSFSQIGDDRSARDYLSTLDDDKRIGNFVDATSSFKLEAEEWKRNGKAMSEDDYLMKTIVGACDPTFDSQDDSGNVKSRMKNFFRS